MKKISLFLLVILNIFVYNVSAENVSCSYVREKGSCVQRVGDWDDGKTFSVQINIDEKENLSGSLFNTELRYVNNNSSIPKIWILRVGSTDVSAVEYYKTTDGTCPPYFGIQEEMLQIRGYFLSENTDLVKSYTTCVFPLEKIEYDENLTKEEEIYSCSLYSSNFAFSNISVNVRINYTKNTISLDNDFFDENLFERYVSNYDFSQKEKCPINEFKVCLNNDIRYLGLVDSELPTKYCTVLDSSQKLEIGDSYCGPFKKYTEKIASGENANNNYLSLKSFCNTILANESYDSYKYSCINLCLNVQDWVPKNQNNDNGEIVSKDLNDYVTNIVKWLKYIIPVIVIVLGILDFIKAIVAEKDDELKKAQSSFIKRLIAAALIFIIPSIIEFILDKMGF